MLPKRIYFTGVPGSRWSGLAQMLETLDGVNTTDRTPERNYEHTGFTGHKGAYFGTGMEFEAVVGSTDHAWADPNAGTMFVKSHEWPYHFDDIKERCDKTGDWIMLVYRPDLPSNDWWFQAGGYDIKYPNYDYYKGPGKMLSEIQKQNTAILRFAYDNKLTWSYFTNDWIKENFGSQCEIEFPRWADILVTIYKP